MTNAFLISDTHWGHQGVCNFTHNNQPLRPWDDAAEMDEAMVERWNAVVRPNDRVYHLGDVAIARRHVATTGRCNGKKVLVKGNHDIFKLKEYTPYFEDIRAYKVFDGMLFSHIPVHTSNLYRFGVNVHGHTHAGRVEVNGSPDPNYLSVCVEHTNFAPISIEDVRQRIIAQGGTAGFKY